MTDFVIGWLLGLALGLSLGMLMHGKTRLREKRR